MTSLSQNMDSIEFMLPMLRIDVVLRIEPKDRVLRMLIPEPADSKLMALNAEKIDMALKKEPYEA